MEEKNRKNSTPPDAKIRSGGKGRSMRQEKVGELEKQSRTRPTIKNLKDKMEGIYIFAKMINIAFIKDPWTKESTLRLKGPIHTQGPEGTEDAFKES